MVTTLLAADGDTWGIGGPTFVAVYLLLIVVLAVAAMLDRRAIRREPGRRPPAGWDRDPHRVAYLNDGPELAVTAALSALHLDGLIAAKGRSVTRVGDLNLAGRAPLERAIVLSAATPTTRPALARRPAVAAELDAIEADLVGRGLLLDLPRRRRALRWGRWMLALLALGVLRLSFGAIDGKPIAYLVLLLVGCLAAAIALLRELPRRTVLGDREMERLRRDHHTLAPRLRPDWVVGGAMAAGMGVAVFGAEALWTADPAFAGEVMAREAAARAAGSGSGSGSHSCSGSSGGGTSCGGGSSGGGSSCGGGGGCGG